MGTFGRKLQKLNEIKKKLAPIYIASLPISRERKTPLLLVRYGYCYYEGFLLIQLNTYLFVFCILIIITHFFVKHILGRQKRACIKKEKFYVKLIVHFTKKKFRLFDTTLY